VRTQDACVLSKLRQATKRGVLRTVTGTCTGGWMGWPGMPWTLVTPQSAMLRYIGRRGHARLAVLRLSDNHIYTAGARFGRTSKNQHCTIPPSLCTTVH